MLQQPKEYFSYAPESSSQSLGVSSLPERVPLWRQKHFWFVAGASGLVACFILVVAVYAINSYRVSSLRAKAQLSVAIEEAVSSCSTEDVSCANGMRTSTARTRGDVGGCNGIAEPQAFANCVSLVALDSGDVAACDALSGEMQTMCRDQVILRVTAVSGVLSDCERIEQQTLRTACVARVTQRARDTHGCEALGVDAAVCSAQVTIDEILARGDYAECQQFSAEERERCEDAFQATDADVDGMNAYDEYMAGTSDQLADTDGDGYADLQEIRTGHDPLR